MSNKIKLFVVALAVAFAVWFYFTPYLAARGMNSAAEMKDAAKLSSYVNFPVLKENLKASLSARLASDVTKSQRAKPFVALGAALASAIANPMIDALVTPESLEMMMKGDKPQPAKGEAQSKPTESDGDTSMSYESFDRFVVNVRKKNSSEEPIGLVFNREGLFSWKLAALRLPI